MSRFSAESDGLLFHTKPRFNAVKSSQRRSWPTWPAALYRAPLPTRRWNAMNDSGMWAGALRCGASRCLAYIGYIPLVFCFLAVPWEKRCSRSQRVCESAFSFARRIAAASSRRKRWNKSKVIPQNSPRTRTTPTLASRLTGQHPRPEVHDTHRGTAPARVRNKAGG